MKKIVILLLLFVGPPMAIWFLTTGKYNFKQLRYYGEHTTFDTIIDGEAVVDTIYYKVPDFSFTNQNGEVVTQATFADKVYVANFFFASCPTICPTMTNQLKRAAYELKDIPDFAILSHTVDPERDTTEALKAYAESLSLDESKWHFVRGEKEYTYAMGRNGYYLSSQEEPNAPGGFLHSEMAVLVDKDRHIRGFYDATNTDEIDRMVEEVHLLYKEELIAKKALRESQQQ